MIDLNPAEKQTLDNASRALQDNISRSPETIQKMVEASAVMASISFPDLSVDRAAITAELINSASVWSEKPATLTNGKVKPWVLANATSIAPWRFWDRYRTYLLQEKGIRDKALNGIDDLTGHILDKIENPKKNGEWDVRGMVVGSVQSGKTANYVGLIAKALDAGYKLVIVMAGIHNNLRAQTQERIDEGIVGFDSQRRLDPNRTDYRIGVGTQFSADSPRITPLTSSAENGDFTIASQKVTVQLGGDPVILVVKKNKTPLEHILKWTDVLARNQTSGNSHARIKDIPLLLIDDEADNASINTKDKPGIDEETNFTTINTAIRLILKRFEQSSYVGYTATPFANIFINPEASQDALGPDLFPRDFIVNVPPNSNYVGPAKIFGFEADLESGIQGENPLPVFRAVSDHEIAFPPKHKKTHYVQTIPESLKAAILAFLLGVTMRRVRGQRKVHNSMLIHVTWLTAVQNRVHELVLDEFRKIKRSIAYAQGDASDPVWKKLQDLWESDYVTTTKAIRELTCDERLTSITWEEVASELHEAAERVEVRQINGLAKEALDYSRTEDGLHVIAVGGNKLSRGLTLEGLTVSYFIRSTQMYDTLMQMGRWFGYREGYVDLCRLYTTPDLRDWFRHIALAEAELKREFDKMDKADLTPLDYGLRVRQHPDGLLVTALNKMAHGSTRSITFAGQLVQTTYFQKTGRAPADNFAALQAFITRLGPSAAKSSDETVAHLWKDVSAPEIIEFISGGASGMTFHPKCTRFGPELAQFITSQQDLREISLWTVALLSNSLPKARRLTLADGVTCGLIVRKEQASTGGVYSLIKSNLLSPRDEALDLELMAMDQSTLEAILAKCERRPDGSDAKFLIRTEEERKIMTDSVGGNLYEAALKISRQRQFVGEYRSNNIPDRPYGDVIRQLRPASNGLLLIYPLDPTDVEMNTKVDCIPGIALSFPASHRARQVDYKVTPGWIKLHGLQEEAEDEDD